MSLEITNKEVRYLKSDPKLSYQFHRDITTKSPE